MYGPGGEGREGEAGGSGPPRGAPEEMQPGVGRHARTLPAGFQAADPGPDPGPEGLCPAPSPTPAFPAKAAPLSPGGRGRIKPEPRDYALFEPQLPGARSGSEGVRGVACVTRQLEQLSLQAERPQKHVPLVLSAGQREAPVVCSPPPSSPAHSHVGFPGEEGGSCLKKAGGEGSLGAGQRGDSCSKTAGKDRREEVPEPVPCRHLGPGLPLGWMMGQK